MLSAGRQRVLFRSLKAAQASTKRAFTASANGLQQNVSKTNEVPTPAPLQDKALQESVDEGEKFRLMQEPNRAGTWSRNQQPRAVAMSGPRFEQTIMQAQVCYLAFPLLSCFVFVNSTFQRKILTKEIASSACSN